MTVPALDLGFYALAMVGLWAIPGPVWVALIARTLGGGFGAAWPLAVGVAMGDLVWPLAAILGLTWIDSRFGDVLGILRWAAAVVFVVMGAALLRRPAGAIGTDRRLTRPGLWAGFTVGLAAVIGNPKAMLFYLGALPGFFAPGSLGAPDIAAVIAISAIVPMMGNLGLALSVDRARRLVSSPGAMRRMRLVAGGLLICVGIAIPLL